MIEAAKNAFEDSYNAHPDSDMDVAHTVAWEHFRRGWMRSCVLSIEKACKIVFEKCDSDNVAQRTVDEIRKLMVE